MCKSKGLTKPKGEVKANRGIGAFGSDVGVVSPSRGRRLLSGHLLFGSWAD